MLLRIFSNEMAESVVVLKAAEDVIYRARSFVPVVSITIRFLPIGNPIVTSCSS